MFDLSEPHENGVTTSPRFAIRRVLSELIRFRRTLKYGLSVSADPAVAVVMRRRVPAGVANCLASSVCGQMRRPISGPFAPLYDCSFDAKVYCIERSALSQVVTCACVAPVRLMRL